MIGRRGEGVARRTRTRTRTRTRRLVARVVSVVFPAASEPVRPRQRILRRRRDPAGVSLRPRGDASARDVVDLDGVRLPPREHEPPASRPPDGVESAEIALKSAHERGSVAVAHVQDATQTVAARDGEAIAVGGEGRVAERRRAEVPPREGIRRALAATGRARQGVVFALDGRKTRIRGGIAIGGVRVHVPVGVRGDEGDESVSAVVVVRVERARSPRDSRAARGVGGHFARGGGFHRRRRRRPC